MTFKNFWRPLGLCAFAMGACLAAAAHEPQPDWPNLSAYRSANAQLPPPAKGERRVVFMGDSITEFWAKAQWHPQHINRGISGQTTHQMLLRFRQDVIALRPNVVVILAGTNDVAGNTGPATTDMIAGNIASMVELAQTHGIRVVLASVLPASAFYWAPDLRPAEKIVELNGKIRALAQSHGCVHLDYFSPMVNDSLGLKREFSDDGVHPNEVGYITMSRLVQSAIAKALKSPQPRSAPVTAR